MGKKASVKISGIDKARDNILKFLNETSKDKEILNELGKTTTDQIRNRTRARLEDYKQKDLKKSTVEIRKELVKLGNAFNSDIVKANKSNLSMTGQLLDALKFKIDQANSLVTVYLSKPRAPVMGIQKTLLDKDELDNVEVKNDLEKRGRKFFFISEKLQSQLESKIAQSLRRKLSLFNQLRRKLSL